VKEILDQLIIEELKPAVGCTEPISVAFTASMAAKYFLETGDEIAYILVELDKNVFKNGKDVCIPSPIPLRGNLYAAPLGALIAKPEWGLKILQNPDRETCEIAKQMVAENRVSIKLNSEAKELFVQVTIAGKNGNSVTALTKKRHDQIVSVTTNGKVVLEKSPATSLENKKKSLAEIPFREFFDFCRTFDLETDLKKVLQESIEMNRKVMEAGLSGIGTGIGSKIIELGRSECPMNFMISRCAAAVDARMAGMSLPVMSVAGSGNQGLILFLSNYLYASQINANEEQLFRALLIAIFLTSKIKEFSGRLSAICGCVIASGMACASSLSFLDGLPIEGMENSFNLMASDIMGILCDGAKSSCALKAATGVNSLLRSIKLSKMGFSIPPNYGIIGENIDKTIENIGKISNPGMLETDREIIKIISSEG